MLHKMSKHTTDWCKYLFDAHSQGSPTFTMELDDKENISKAVSYTHLPLPPTPYV